MAYRKHSFSAGRRFSPVLAGLNAAERPEETNSAHPEDWTLQDCTVCFTGHRQIATGVTGTLAAALDAQLQKLYDLGYKRFFCGGAMGFDLLAAQRVIHFRQTHSDVALLFALPCANQTEKWPTEEKARYEQLLYAADEIRVLSPRYYHGCMMVRNRYMVDRAAVCVCYMVEFHGGTAYTVSYAVKNDRKMINLALDCGLQIQK